MATSIDRCIVKIAMLSGGEDGLRDGDNYSFKYFSIPIDPERFFLELVGEFPEIPEPVKNALVAKIDDLSKEYRIVLVHLSGRHECEYPKNWHLPLLKDLFSRSIFVDVNIEYRWISKYTELLAANHPTQEDVMNMTKQRAQAIAKNRVMARIANMTGSEMTALESNHSFKYFKISIDVSDVMTEFLQIPDDVKNMLVAKILDISKEYRIVVVEFTGKTSIDLCRELFVKQIFVDADCLYGDYVGSYAKFESLSWKTILNLTNQRQTVTIPAKY